VDQLLGEHGIKTDNAISRLEFERRMETRRADEGDPEQWKGLRQDGIWAGKPSGKRYRLHGQLGPDHSGQMRREVAQALAETIINGQS
jgi:hypothetical protein